MIRKCLGLFAALAIVPVVGSAAYLDGNIGQFKNLIKDPEIKVEVVITYYRKNKFNTEDCSPALRANHEAYIKTGQQAVIPVNEDGSIYLNERIGGEPKFSEKECWIARAHAWKNGIPMSSLTSTMSSVDYFRTTKSNENVYALKDVKKFLNSDLVLFASPKMILNFEIDEASSVTNIAYEIKAFTSEHWNYVQSITGFSIDFLDANHKNRIFSEKFGIAQENAELKLETKVSLASKLIDGTFKTECNKEIVKRFKLDSLPKVSESTIRLSCE